MDVEVVEFGRDDRVVLDHLAQLYQYDLSEIIGADVLPDGRYSFVDMDAFWAMDVRHAFLIRADGRVSGFALVCHSYLHRGPSARTWFMDEFFVLRSYRRRGVGARAAGMLFDMFPGPWEVAQMRAHTAATAFWRKVIGEYTKGAYEEVELDSERWRGPVQYFRTGSKADEP